MFPLHDLMATQGSLADIIRQLTSKPIALVCTDTRTLYKSALGGARIGEETSKAESYSY